MREFYIYHHLGLGDHIMLNGFVRNYVEGKPAVKLFAKPSNINNVRYMFRDISDKLSVIPFDDSQARGFMRMFPMHEYLVVGHTPDFFRRLDAPGNTITFDQMFYDDHSVPFEFKWDKFYFERNDEAEDRAFEIYDLDPDEDYIFIHESAERPVTREIPEGIRQIRPDNMQVGLFDHLGIIRHANEVHVMNSSFMNLIDCIQLQQAGLFYHEYSRPGINTKLKLPWKVLK